MFYKCTPMQWLKCIDFLPYFFVAPLHENMGDMARSPLGDPSYMKTWLTRHALLWEIIDT